MCWSNGTQLAIANVLDKLTHNCRLADLREGRCDHGLFYNQPTCCSGFHGKICQCFSLLLVLTGRKSWRNMHGLEDMGRVLVNKIYLGPIAAAFFRLCDISGEYILSDADRPDLSCV